MLPALGSNMPALPYRNGRCSRRRSSQPLRSESYLRSVVQSWSVLQLRLSRAKEANRLSLSRETMIMAPSSYCRNTLCSIAWGSALLLVLRVSAQAAIAQSPSTSPFQVKYTASGISSLQKVQDKYATDYIQSGLALGDVSIRYRAEGAGQWNEISAASRDPRARGAVAAYSICRLQPTLAGAAHVSASVRGPGVRLLNAPFEPSTSHDIGAARYTWTAKKGSSEWVEYDFDQPQSIHSADVFWAADAGRRINTQLPVCWKGQYKGSDDWKDVQHEEQSPIAADTFNHTTFEPVTTTGIRLQVQLETDATAGLLQWRLNGQPARIVQPGDDLDASETFEPSGDAFVWTLTVRNPTDHPIEIGDLSIGLPINRHSAGDTTE